MTRRFISLVVVLQALLLLGAVPFLPTGIGAPSVTVTSPTDGSLFKSKVVNVTGTASGSDDRWFQTSMEAFNAGTKDNMSLDKNGSASLALTGMLVYDNFDDDHLDTSLWSWNEFGNMTISEANSELGFSGGFSNFNWSEAYITSTLAFRNSVSADLKSFSGTNCEMEFSLYQDDSNKVYFMLRDSYGPNQSQPILYWGYDRGGYGSETYLGALPAGVNNFKISYSGNSTSVYLNNIKKGSIGMSLQYMYARTEASCYGDEGALDARWDNLLGGDFYAECGTLISSVFDTGSVEPVLKQLRWNATAPSGTGLSVQVRSCDAEDMASPTSWANVTNGQSSGLPAAKRYLQYRMTLTSIDGRKTPAFKDIEITYDKPVKMVEVSIDNNATWTLATGTSSWYVNLELPDNTTFIWARVTDDAGETVVTSIKVEVDTTRPAGSVVIDGDAPYTLDRQVELTLNASDHYGVVSMMASEDPEFAGLEWADHAPSLKFQLSEGDGSKTVYVKYLDANGWESTVCNDSILLDTKSPLGNLLIDGGAEFTRNATVTLTLNASDQTGISGMLVSNTADFMGVQWMDYQPSLLWSIAPGGGERSVFAKFMDAGGHISQPCYDSILADTAPPSVSVVINGGATCTRSKNASVVLTPTENYRVVSMQVREGDGPFPAGLPWDSYQPSVELQLSQQDGQKTISARLMDAAGNVGASGTGRIILDATAPKSEFAGFPETSYRSQITVSWDATDAASGVLWYDVQYRVGDGPWTDWLLHTNSTSAVFIGEDSKTYSFRVRAQDKAGNLEDFPATVNNAVTVRLSDTVLTIVNPAAKATLQGKVRIKGTCQPDSEGRDPVQVMVRVDDGPWQLAEGTQNWSFYLDTTKLLDGNHVLRVRTFNGSQYSAETERTVTVDNAKLQGLDWTPVLTVALVIAVAAVGVLAIMLRRRPGAASPNTPLQPR